MTDIVTTEKSALVSAQKSSLPAIHIDPRDILIPRLLIAQAMSDVVSNDLAKAGDFYRSTTKEIIGPKGTSVPLIPLSFNKTWVISKKKGQGRFEFVKTEPFTAENRDLEWFWEEDGFEFKREASLNFFCLLSKDIERDTAARTLFEETGELPDVSDILMPILLSFRSSSYKAGKVLTTHLAMTQDFRVPPYVTTFRLDAEQKQNELGKFYVLKVEKVGKTPKEQLALCERWASVVNAGSVQVDETEVVEAESTGSTNTFTGEPIF